MSDTPPDAPRETPPPEPSPDDLVRALMLGAVPAPSAGSLRKKIVWAALIAAIGVGASVMSCVGQSFSYRQARAMEGIERELREIRASCAAPTSRSP